MRIGAGVSAAYLQSESLQSTTQVGAGGHGEPDDNLRLVRSRGRNLRLVLVLVDVAAVVLAWLGAVVWALYPGGLSADLLLRIAVVVGGATAVTMVALVAGKLYLARVCAVRAVENARLVKAAFVAAVAIVVIAEFMALPWQLAEIVTGGVLSALFLFAGRAGYRAWLAGRRRRGESLWPVVLVGSNSEAASLNHLLVEHPEHGFKVAGVVGPRSEAEQHLPDVPWLGELDKTAWAVRTSGATGAMVAASAVPSEKLNELTRRLVDDGVHVRVSSGLRGISHNRLRAAPVAHEPLFYLERWTLAPWQLAVKRTLDVVLASLLLIVTLPLTLTAAAITKAQDGGPVLFAQQRVGRGGQLFTLYKFRTMVVGAEQRLAELEQHNQRDGGPLFKLAGDPRVTPVGRFFRTTSIDELPQLLNVLQGDMSLVGPRPALPHEMAQFSDRLQMRTTVLPGITGLWQVEARDSPSFWSYERLDLFYVENWSVGLDLSIIATTAASVMRRGFAGVRDAVPPFGREPRARQKPVHVLE